MKAESAIQPLKRDMNDHEKLCLVALSFVEFLRPKEKLSLLEMLGSPIRLFELSLSDIMALIGRRLWTGSWAPRDLLAAAEAAEKVLTAGGGRSIFYWDSTYPPQLREIFDPPVTLFCRGSLPDSGSPLAGVVGTRFPTGAGRAAAYRLGFELARERIGVVSGLARGIDREAHEGCVEAGGASVAVLGCGIDLVYPISSRATARALLDRGGALLSEYPPGVEPLSRHFPERNRIISGLSRAVVVVQAPARSGALITADYALEQGRDLFVHTAGLSGTPGAGTQALAESGAQVIRGAADILRDWGVASAFSREAQREPAMTEGERLAWLLKEEINGACARRGGETYWRT